MKTQENKPEFSTFNYISCEYHIEDENLVIYLFGRDENFTKFTFTINDFKPYLYVPKDEIIKFQEVGNFYTTLFKESVKKITFDNPSDYYDFKKYYNGKHFEGDIRFDNRFLIDTGIRKGFKLSKVKPILYWKDIEGF